MLKLFDIPETPINTKNEWYTPSQYIEAAREVMGSIDLDPASCELANRTVKATRYYTQEEDGLKQEWYGNVWLNPSYHKKDNAQSTLAEWVLYTLLKYEQENISQAILLVPSTQSTQWFTWLWNYALVCFPPSRLRFFDPFERMMDSPRFETCFVYLGNNEAKFIEVFSQVGTIVKRVN